LLIAKTFQAADNLGKQFERRKVKKTYLAWVLGDLSDGMVINDEIEGKEAFTEIIPLKKILHRRHGQLSLVEAKPKTGRRNQIRIHLSNQGFPILGDQKFGSEITGKGLSLFAHQLGFQHPISRDQMKIGATIPKKFGLGMPEITSYLRETYSNLI
jgi:23S rRNA-/tRNA-specific pseudouridylate synthase